MKAHEEYTASRIAHWNQVAGEFPTETLFSSEYHRRLREIYRFLIAPGHKVLEIGCGQGDLLGRLEPGEGVGIDFSGEMITRARQHHPNATFICEDAHQLTIHDTFDVIILSDLLNDLWDAQTVLDQLKTLCDRNTRLILNIHSRVYQPILSIAERLGLAKPMLPQNWFTPTDVENMLYLSGFEVVRIQKEILLPLPIPGIRELCNRFLVKFWPFNSFAWVNVFIARLRPEEPQKLAPSVSVVIPARNESGNIKPAFARIPRMGNRTELIFVEGNSTDDTYETIEREIIINKDWDAKLFKQAGKGKADAVRLGLEKASGDVLMILDADLTVRPEDLPRFYRALIEGKGELINGVRLVYPMQDQAMRFLNLIGNKLFSSTFSWLLGQSIKDTLCGTKVLWKKDYERIAANRNYFGEFDPFGDYDLIFGAAKQNRKIVDMPIRYQERTYGTTNINRWQHGFLLLRMVLIAALRLKFV